MNSHVKLQGKGKGKVIPVLYWALRHEYILEEWRYCPTYSLASALNGGEWSTSRPGRFTLRKRAPDTHWKGCWVGPRARLDAVAKRTNPCLCRATNPGRPLCSLVTILTELSQFLTEWLIKTNLTPFTIQNDPNNCLNILNANYRALKQATGLITRYFLNPCREQFLLLRKPPAILTQNHFFYG